MKKWLKRLKKDERGLTLVELLAVVVILAIVAGIAFVSIGNVIENSKKDAHIANAQQIISAAKLHEASTGELDSIDVTDISTLDENDLIDPWKKETYSKLAESKVTKTVTEEEDESATDYKITLKGSKCSITEKTEEQLRKDKRDDLCQ